MLDGLLGRGFASKCKSLMKLTKSRIDVIKRKRNATQKYLKKDMADLLSNGLDINAYGRAEGLLVELTLSSCYDFVEHCCDFLSKHLSLMQKQSECPDECREAVSSLMFAAARFSDLPELRDLRQTFQERYGNSIDHCFNRQFAENLTPKTFAMEKKVRLMQDIASEFSINWNARNFEQRMSKASALEQNPLKDNGSNRVADDKCNFSNYGKEIPVGQDNLNFPVIGSSSNGHRFRKARETDSLKRDELEVPSDHTRPSDYLKVPQEREVPTLRKDHNETPRQGKQDFSSERRGKESLDPKIMIPDASSYRKGDKYADNGSAHSRARDKNILKRENGHADNFVAPPNSEVKVTSFVRDNGGGNHRSTDSVTRVKSNDDRSYANGCAATPSKNEVKVTSFVRNNDGGSHNATKSMTRVKSDGDRLYGDDFAATSSKSAVKVTSSVLNDGGVDCCVANPLTRVKSEGDRRYFNCALPPPYVKANVKAKNIGHIPKPETASANPDVNGIPKSPAVHKSTRVEEKSEDVVQIGMHHPEKAKEGNGHADEKDYHKHWDEANGFPLPKARSHRRRHSSRSRSANDEAREHDEDAGVGKRSSRSRRKDDPRRGLQVLFDDERDQKDEEERIIDKLLIHYSKKSSTYEGERVKRKSRSRRHNVVGTDLGESPLNRRAETERPGEEFGVIPPPSRSVSLPREHPSAPPVPTKAFTRAATFQLDRSDAAKHVHPKLPDYDDLAARFAALKGR